MAEKILCPYCGAWNRHPDGVEMIPQRESMGMRMGYDYLYCPRCAARGPGVYTQDGNFEGKQEAARAAALRRFTPMQKPLTLEEVRGIKSLYPLWIEYKVDGLLTPKIMMPHGSEVVVHFNNIGEWADSYGITYRCWRTRPTDEERQAARWEDDPCH